MWFLIGGRFPQLGQPALMTAATLATALGIAAAYLAAWLAARRSGLFPIAGAAVAVLAAYLVLNKVFSPQYIIWLLPLLVLAGFRVGELLFYVLLDPVMFVALNLAGGALFRREEAGGWLTLLLVSVTVRFWYVIAVGAAALLPPGRRRRGGAS